MTGLLTGDRLGPLESSEGEFTTRFAAHAAEGLLYPQREGSPLLEFSAGGRVLYLFDRNGPYAAAPGPARVIVHGVLEEFTRLAPEDAAEEALTSVGISQVEGRGQVVAVQRSVCVVQARLPLVLAAFTALPALAPGDWVAFRTAPPLHGFTL